MSRHSATSKLVFSALFIAIGLLLPFFTAQIPQFGKMLLPMHIPVLLCGFVCGWQWGLAVGALTPLLRSLFFFSPVFYPNAIAMALELAAYGCAAGLLYRLFRNKQPRLAYLYLALLLAMISGRIVWGVARTVMLLFPGALPFSPALFLSGAVLTALPGILLQLALIPPSVLALERIGQ